MAATGSRGSSNRSTSRARASSDGSGGSKEGSSAAKRSSNKGSSSSRSSGASSRGRQAGGAARKRAGTAKAGAKENTSAAASRASEASRSAAEKVSPNGTREALTNAGVAAAAGALGVAGGVLLGRTRLQRTRKVLGIRMPVAKPVKIDLGDVTKHVGEAGKQIGRLATEVRAVREKAEQVGRVIS
jgi:hypothetical protein